MPAGLKERVEAILRGDADDGLTARLADATARLAEIANNLPPPGASVRHEGSETLDAVFEVVYVRGDPWVALPARIGESASGRTHDVLRRIDELIGSRLERTVTEIPTFVLYANAAQRARALRALFTNKGQYYHGALALAVCADEAHTAAILARTSIWNRTRVALVRAGHGIQAPTPRANAKPTLRQAVADAVASASPLASITRAAVATQVLVLCAVACFGQRGLRCVLAALVSGMRTQIAPAVAQALGKVAETLLPESVRAMLVPSADVACAAASLTGLLAAAGLVPSLVAVAARAAAECPPATAALPYDAPCRLIAAACDVSALLVQAGDFPAATLPATGDLAEWSRWHAGDAPKPATGDAGEWGRAIGAHLASTERLFQQRDTLRHVLRHVPSLPDAMHPTLARLTVCAIVAASGAWGPWNGTMHSLARGTMLSYLAWDNPALATALQLCE